MHAELTERSAFASLWQLASLVAIASLGLHLGCKACSEEAAMEEEERSLERDHYWSAQVSIVGAGAVRSTQSGIDCASDGIVQRGPCGPVFLRFKELSPAMLEATPAPGWRLDRWESRTREPDGAVVARRGPMPDGARYVNGFGYTDTGELEMVTAVFVAIGGATR
jgi:hypothetical protein